MLQPINDVNVEREAWFDHNPLDGSNIGGTMPKEGILIQDLPGEPAAIILALNGPAWSTMECSVVRQNFVNKGFAYVTATWVVMIDDKGSAHIFELDEIFTVRMLDGTVWKFNGSLQLNVDEGWMVQTDENLDAKGGWVDDGVKIPALTPNIPHVIQKTHFVDMANKAHSVLSIAVDGTSYPLPAANQKIPAALTNWAGDLVLPQGQITLKGIPAGAVGSVTLKILGVSIQHRTTL